MKYPIGIQSFEQIIEDGYVYLDKTDLVYDLVHNGKIYFLCRPRRFGKSLLVSTLKCYFEGRKELFKGLSIDGLEKDWKRYPVFHIDFNGKNFTEGGELEKTLNGFVESQEAIYGKDPYHDTLGDRFCYVLKAAHEKTGLRAVVLIDEYDKPLLDVLDQDLCITIGGQKRKLEDWNRDVLKAFYSVFKAADADLQFVLLTGVTKFSQVSVFSGFNQPDDISMDERYEALCGITEEELYTKFDTQIKEMAARYKVSEDEMKHMLKRKFDGYHFSPNMLDFRIFAEVIAVIISCQFAETFLIGKSESLAQSLDVGLHLSGQFCLADAADGRILVEHTDIVEVVQLTENTELRELRYAGDKRKFKIRIKHFQRTVEVLHNAAQYSEVLFLMHYIKQRCIVFVDDNHHLFACLFICSFYKSNESRVRRVLFHTFPVYFLVWQKDEVKIVFQLFLVEMLCPTQIEV